MLGIPAYIAYRWMMPGFIAAAIIGIAHAFSTVPFTWKLTELPTAILLLGVILAFGFLVSVMSYAHILLLREFQKIIYYYINVKHQDNNCFSCCDDKSGFAKLSILNNKNGKYFYPKFVLLNILCFIPIVDVCVYYCKKKKIKNNKLLDLETINVRLSKIYNDTEHRNVSQDMHLAFGAINIGYTVVTASIYISTLYTNILWIPIIAIALIIYILSCHYSWKMLGFGYDKLYKYYDYKQEQKKDKIVELTYREQNNNVYLISIETKYKKPSNN